MAARMMRVTTQRLKIAESRLTLHFEKNFLSSQADDNFLFIFV
jgi:hypothetical protein